MLFCSIWDLSLPFLCIVPFQYKVTHRAFPSLHSPGIVCISGLEETRFTHGETESRRRQETGVRSPSSVTGKAEAQTQDVSLSSRGSQGRDTEPHWPPDFTCEVPTIVAGPAEPGATKQDEETARFAFQSITTTKRQSDQQSHLARDIPQRERIPHVTGSAGGWPVLLGSAASSYSSAQICNSCACSGASDRRAEAPGSI